MKPANHGRTWLVALLLAFGAGFNATAQPTNAADSAPVRVGPASPKFDESAFRIVSERNIFNANRSGGQVRLPSRRASSVESFTLVGTMEYEKGTFAFFEGSNSQFTKVMKADEVIGGHKLLGISPHGVKLQADGKDIELPVGAQMRREDEGAWQVAEARGLSAAASGNGESSRRDDRDDRNSRSDRGRNDNSDSSNRRSSSTAAPTSANEDEVLKRLMERRQKESQ